MSLERQEALILEDLLFVFMVILRGPPEVDEANGALDRVLKDNTSVFERIMIPPKRTAGWLGPSIRLHPG
jgi:hypothetical protein